MPVFAKVLSIVLLIACRADPPAAFVSRPPPPPAAPAPAPVRLDAPGAVVAVGDVHADPGALLDVLRLAGLVDASGRWSGGDTWLVQTGDQLDRGPDARGTLAVIRRLSAEAEAAGGRVIALNGNHEVMNLLGDWRYVSPEDVAGYGGEAARRAAFAPTGEDGAWLLARDIAVDIEGTVFVHGGIDARWARHGVRGLNALARAALLGQGPPDVLGEDGPLWNRALVLSAEPAACPELERALAALGAMRMVVGHTRREDGRIQPRCGQRLWAIDTGLSTHYGRHLAALRIADGHVTTVYPP